MRLGLRVAVLLVTVWPYVVSHADLGPGQKVPSTPEQRAKVVAMVRALEADPLASNAAQMRHSLLAWLIDVPDISVNMCLPLLGSFRDVKRYPYYTQIAPQPEFAEAAFKIEHPDEADNDRAVYAAGLESALRVYEAILKSKPNARLKVLDDFVAMRNRGELSKHVAEATEQCK